MAFQGTVVSNVRSLGNSTKGIKSSFSKLKDDIPIKHKHSVDALESNLEAQQRYIQCLEDLLGIKGAT